MAIWKKSKKENKEEKTEGAEVVQPEDSGRVISFSTAAKPDFLVKQSWITEKAGRMSGDRKYIFITRLNANKSEIKKAIQSLYKVKVQDVNILKTKGKSKQLGRSRGRTSDFKKAIVTLKEGQKIEALTP